MLGAVLGQKRREHGPRYLRNVNGDVMTMAVDPDELKNAAENFAALHSPFTVRHVIDNEFKEARPFGYLTPLTVTAFELVQGDGLLMNEWQQTAMKSFSFPPFEEATVALATAITAAHDRAQTAAASCAPRTQPGPRRPRRTWRRWRTCSPTSRSAMASIFETARSVQRCTRTRCKAQTHSSAAVTPPSLLLV